MNYQIHLEHTINIFKRMNISSNIIYSPNNEIPSTIDLQLREMLFQKSDYANLLHNSLQQAQENTIYCFYDEYECKYIFLQLPNVDNTYFFIGPYLLESIHDNQVEEKIHNLGLPEEKISILKTYYAQLPIIEDENILFAIINTLADVLWEQYSLEYVEYMIPDFIDPIVINNLIQTDNEYKFTLEMIEQNYENEKVLITAISKGQLHKVSHIASSVFTNGTEQRLKDNLRNRKNYLIILNTLLRKGAEYGSVHPLHIHNLSSLFAKKIENILTLKDSFKLQEDMIKEYCLLVKNHSLKKYSSLIGRIITLIEYDLTQDLSLHTLAEKVNVNASYLSTAFKKECDITLTDYIHKKRLEKALQLLNHTNKQIQTIAYECGIQDTNYFIKLFKKETGITPSQYRKLKTK